MEPSLFAAELNHYDFFALSLRLTIKTSTTEDVSLSNDYFVACFWGLADWQTGPGPWASIMGTNPEQELPLTFCPYLLWCEQIWIFVFFVNIGLGERSQKAIYVLKF